MQLFLGAVPIILRLFSKARGHLLYSNYSRNNLSKPTRDVITHRNQYKISCKIHFRMASKTHVQICHTRATVTALMEFLYKRMPLHLVYTITMLVCEKLRR